MYNKSPDMINQVNGKGKSDEIDHLVGSRLKERRILMGLTQKDLGQAVNVSIQQIQKYEKATNRITCGKLYALAKFLDVSIAFFFGEGGEYGERDFRASSGLTAFAQNKKDYKTSENEAMILVRCFNAMKDSKIRKQVLVLIKTMSSNQTSKAII